MDLSFSRTLKREGEGSIPLLAFDLSVLLAASAALQAVSPTARAVASVRRDQAGEKDRLQVLAGLFAPLGHAPVDISCLGGSFNILISDRLMVGQDK